MCVRHWGGGGGGGGKTPNIHLFVSTGRFMAGHFICYVTECYAGSVS